MPKLTKYLASQPITSQSYGKPEAVSHTDLKASSSSRPICNAHIEHDITGRGNQPISGSQTAMSGQSLHRIAESHKATVGSDSPNHSNENHVLHADSVSSEAHTQLINKALEKLRKQHEKRSVTDALIGAVDATRQSYASCTEGTLCLLEASATERSTEVVHM